MDVERHCMLYWDIDAMRSKLPFRLSKIWQPNLKGWMETFSNHALKILQEQIQTAVNYKVEVIHSSLSWKVSRKEICSENFCIVSRKEPHNNSSLNPLGAGIFNAWSTHDTSAVICIERVCNPGRHCQGIKGQISCVKGQEGNLTRGKMRDLVGIWPPKPTLKITRGSVLLGSQLGSN